jgi:hypothetical protein
MKNKMPTLTIFVSIAPIVGIALLLIGCGSSNSNSNNGGLTASQAQAVASAMSSGVSQAVAGGFGASSATDAHKVVRKEDSAPNSSAPTCSTTSSGDSCNWPISETFTCPGGGSLSVSGDVSGSLDFAGDGSVQEQITAVPSNCSIDGVVFNANPQITVTGQLGISNGSPLWPLTGTETGGITFGPNPSGSCQVNVNFSVNSDLSCSVSGMVCGQPVNGSC